MKVTKYPQSCLVVEGDGRRLLIDPGVITMNAFSLDDFGAVDAVLYTHQHPDHYDENQVDELLDRGATLYGNADVCDKIGGDRASEVTDGETFEVAGFEIAPRDLPHVEMVDGSPGPPNTGYVIDGMLFHPGDGAEIEGLRVTNLALPIAGPSISFRTAYRFTESLGAELVIPIHYDLFTANPELFEGFCDVAKVVILGHGDSVDL
ncbi:MAG: MBL fold metallo-hydrolase [Nitriliruptorales bacterium]